MLCRFGVGFVCSLFLCFNEISFSTHKKKNKKKKKSFDRAAIKCGLLVVSSCFFF